MQAARDGPRTNSKETCPADEGAEAIDGAGSDGQYRRFVGRAQVKEIRHQPRQRGRERGENVLDVPHNSEAIRAAIERQLASGRYKVDHLYGDGRAGDRIAQVLARTSLDYDKVFTY